MTYKHFHFIGVGGIGMGALASLLLEKGKIVSGSDLNENRLSLSLQKKGAYVFLGHDTSHLGNADCVIYSSAVPKDNVELVEAKRRNLKIMRRAELLAELMKPFKSITVAGAHGKTTTTSMVSSLLNNVGLHPTTAIGGVLNGEVSNAALGKGQYFVAEVDESDGTFLNFYPNISIVTNVDLEHVDHYGNWDKILEAYQQFFIQTKKNGILIVNGDDANIKKFLGIAEKEFLTFGLLESNNLFANNITFHQFGSKFTCWFQREKLGEIRLSVPGIHNVRNALACIALGLHLKIDFDKISKSLSSFQGVQRRFQLLSHVNDVMFVDDYGHHPTEIRATLETAQKIKSNRLVTIFQPHRYSRTKFLMNEFVKELANTDELIITDIYAASEIPIEGITAQSLCEKITLNSGKKAVYVSRDQVEDFIYGSAKPGDLLLFLGAGDVNKIAPKISEKIENDLKVKSKQKSVNI